MKKQRYIVEIEMPDGDFISAGWLKDLIQTDCDVEDESRKKVTVQETSLPSNLDEAAEEYGHNTFINECMENGVCDDHDLSDAFKAGAEWQKEQDQETIELAEEHAMLAGRMQMKEQMMKEAVKGLICATITGTDAISFLSPLPKELKAGDKVHIIIVKEDEL